jgi:hypothetical protein
MQGTTSALVPIASAGGPYHQLRVSAQNQLGVGAESPAGDVFQLNVHDDTDASYDTAWTQPADSAAYGGHVHNTTSSGATATITFTGRSLALVAPIGPGRGAIEVCLDDPSATVGPCTSSLSLASATAVAREVVYVSGFSTGTHKIEVVTQNTSPVALDGFVVLG